MTSFYGVLLIILFVLAILWFIFMIVGDVYISTIAFDTTSSITCITSIDELNKLLIDARNALDNEKKKPTKPPASTETTTTSTNSIINDLINKIINIENAIANYNNQTESTQNLIYNIAPPTVINRASKIKSEEIGFARFRVALNWIVFIMLTYYSFLLIIEYKEYKSSKGLYILFTILVNLLWLFLLVGGIFISEYVFKADIKNCNGTNYYYYNLTDSSLNLVKIYSILSFLITFGIIALIIYIYRSSSY